MSGDFPTALLADFAARRDHVGEGMDRREQELLAGFRLRMARVATAVGWITIGAVALYALLYPGHVRPPVPEAVWVLLAAAGALNVGTSSRAWLRRIEAGLDDRPFQLWTTALIAFDSAVLLFSGDPSSDIYLIYLPVVLFSAVTLGPRGQVLALLGALGASLTIVLLVDPDVRLAEVIVRVAAFGIASLLGGYVARQQRIEIAAHAHQEARARARGRELARERERARELDAELGTIIDILAEGLIVVDAGRRVAAINPAAERLLGWPNEDVAGRPYGELLDALDEAGRPIFWEDSPVGRGEADSGIKVAIRRRQGGRVLCDVSGAIRRDGGGRLVGYLYTLRDIRQEEEQRQELLQHVALRGELLAKVISAQEEERMRIARELHDGAVQSLAAISMQLGLIQEMPSEEFCAAQPRVAAARAAMQHTLDEIRRVMHNLRPSALDDLGLVTALHEHARSQLTAAGVDLRWQVSGRPHRLPPPVETAVFRILQEGVNNAVRHAHATSTRVEVRFANDELHATVEDDGIGFDPATVRHGRLGLLGMQERAALLGGTVRIETSPGKGTRLDVEIPLMGSKDE